jgi:hypothetical protein
MSIDTVSPSELDALVQRAGWSREELIARLASDGEDYAPVLHGHRDPTLLEATFLAALLQVSVKAILGTAPQPRAIVCTDSGCHAP